MVAFNLGRLFEESDPEAARGWYEQAANAGYTQAMVNRCSSRRCTIGFA